jgi:Protein of unknown function (DUF1329)
MKSVIPLLAVFLCHALPAAADVSPGDRIDRTNWEKLEGLVPDPVLDWVKNGDFTLDIDELQYTPRDYFPQFAREAFEANAGKYDLNEDEGIVDVSTGKMPEQVVGLPFPDVELDDPRLPQKVMYNALYMQYILENLRFPFQSIYMGRSGFEREIGCIWQQAAMDGYPGAQEKKNPDRVEKYSILLVKRPFDLAGTAIMLWRYLDPRMQDSSFGYIPAIRRVRRMSPANRSDALLGSDFSVDDANGYDGKITAFAWKFLGKQEMIAPALSTEAVRVVKNEDGEWETTKTIPAVLYGYQKQGWQGASWAPTNLAWVKRPAYLLEMRPKDPYYNYGPQYLWVEAEIFGCAYKVIHDKSGAYWKTFFSSAVACASADGKMRFISLASQQAVDDRSDHSSVIEDASPRNEWHFYADVDLNDFSLAGFQKFCK